MRKRSSKQIRTTPRSSKSQLFYELRRQPSHSARWRKKGVLIAVALLILTPVTLILTPEIIQYCAYKYRLKVPFFVDLSRPTDFYLDHTVNMYLEVEDGVSLGVWHTVPEHLWEEMQGKRGSAYQNALSDGSPIFIYLHGNTGTRAAPHRIGVVKLLSKLGYHVVAPDYRGFGDSTGEPTESGLTADAIFLYNWVRARSGQSLIIIWGHSLGTGVTTNTAVELLEKGIIFDGVILEGTFNSVRQHIPSHPFSWFYCKLPSLAVFCHLFERPMPRNEIIFPTEENLKKMMCPILFLHSEDDHLVPIEIARQTYKVAVNAQSPRRVKMVTFDGALGYLHNGLYRDPKLPDVIEHFVNSL